MSDERVERVARAICAAQYDDEYWETLCLGAADSPDAYIYQRELTQLIVQARAAVAALDEEPLQDRVGAWGTRTFPASTEMNIIAHLRDEVVELEEAVALQGPGDAEAAAVEAADAYLLLLHLAHRYGFDLQAAAEAKFAIVQTRSYTTDSGRGYLRHDAKGGAS